MYNSFREAGIDIYIKYFRLILIRGCGKEENYFHPSIYQCFRLLKLCGLCWMWLWT
ncbi:hypothetical protein CLOSCI_01936 [[Clostridium] scindens ATCC 35704]|nr:hypothetical protein CLOSCI_01936 [[Clostridium] scindens ATCC 35704]